ncbi:hypothetical protein RRG08_066478 [Elysia crispata]|uniref:Uncharacterized protein n=1 Tax=Elysia crispata TaxID=231223 RepID=A0AAE1ADP7_9GAST|nr:hypothetical protein RRG08_066478 [Elysia crispata]
MSRDMRRISLRERGYKPIRDRDTVGGLRERGINRQVRRKRSEKEVGRAEMEGKRVQNAEISRRPRRSS